MSDRRYPCQVCDHPDRQAIETAILSRKTLRGIAEQFGIGSNPGTPGFKLDHTKVMRHRDDHMAGAFQKALEADELAAGRNLVERMHELDEVVNESLERLRRGVPVSDENGPMLDPDGKPVLRHNESQIMAAVREARRNVETQARLAGALPEGDADALDMARLALADPRTRKMINDVEALLADSAGQG